MNAWNDFDRSIGCEFFFILLKFHCRIASFSIEFMLKLGLQINSLLYTWERLYFWSCLKKSRFLIVYQYWVILLDILKNLWISIKLDWNLIKCLWFLGPDQNKKCSNCSTDRKKFDNFWGYNNDCPFEKWLFQIKRLTWSYKGRERGPFIEIYLMVMYWIGYNVSF